MEKVKNKTFFQKMAEFFFVLYMVTLYIFVDRTETVRISQAVFLLFVGCTGIFILQRQRVHMGKGVMGVYIAFTWMFASVLWAQNEYFAWSRAKTMWQLFVLFFFVYNLYYEEENAHETVVKALYIAGIALIGYSIYTYGLGEVIKKMTSSSFRFGKEINQENTFGMLNATTVMAGFYYIFYKEKHKIFHAAVIAAAFLFAMSSGSRKALLMICIAVVYMIYKKYGIQKLYKALAVILVCVLLFSALIRLPVFNTVRERMESFFHFLENDGQADNSSMIRNNMIEDGWKLFKERIITGYGANNFAAVSRYGTYAHNNFIEMLVDFGIVGFFLYYMIYFNAFKNLKNVRSDAGKALFCVFMTRLLMEIAMITYYDKRHWILMAFFLIKEQRDETETLKEVE